ncbi:MAG: HDOD domain-containing protein [Gammaproteobacteria bacterium]|nr:HDOD domain-containing protein [Gammaproteobacteria bacterium]MBT8152265.1 HDOD domain-containing protein [Gammaproteobacteria bacterium]NNM11248.1 HDOD domain-containing protein [Pseudomonadales bacterium]RZV56296.1 MAG: HDOD domain-containing protein [Pseudomonadales bacterium]
MTTIAFVDDERNILDGIRRSLRKYRKEWNLHFFETADAMLESMQSERFDAIISDMRMPKKNGLDLLTEARTKSPETIRIVLSGYSEEEIVLESLHVTHSFIAKPANTETIVDCIEKTLRTREWLKNEELRHLLGSIDSLPTLPAIYDALMQELASPDCSMQNVANIVASDSALSSTALKIINSAFFGLARHIESVQQAVNMLGIETIKNIALVSSVFSSVKADKSIIAKMDSLNANSIKMGNLAQKLSKASGLDKRGMDHTQIAAMMSQLGDLISVCYKADLEKANAGDIEPALIGSYMLSIWNLPFAIIDAVRWHREPASGGIPELHPLTIVHAAWGFINCYKDTNAINLQSDYLDREYLLGAVDQQTLDEWAAIALEYCGSSDGDD